MSIHILITNYPYNQPLLRIITRLFILFLLSIECTSDRFVSKHVLATPRKIYAMVHEVHSAYQNTDVQNFTSTDGKVLISTVYQGYNMIINCSISYNIPQIERFKKTVKKLVNKADTGSRNKSKALLTQPVYRTNIGLMVNMKEQYQRCRKWKKMGSDMVKYSHQELVAAVKLANREVAFIMHERWCNGHVPGTALASVPVHNCCRDLRQCVKHKGKDSKEKRRKCHIHISDYPSLLNCECNEKFSECLTAVGTKEALKTRNIFLAYSKGKL